MEKSKFESFFQNVGLDSFLGLLLLIFTLSVAYNLGAYYAAKIPSDAEYTEREEITRDYSGEVDVDHIKEYTNERYNEYNYLSNIFYSFPIFILAILIGLWQHFNNKLDKKLDHLRYSDKSEDLDEFQKSWSYHQYKNSFFYNFCSGYFIGFILFIIALIPYLIFTLLILRLFPLI